MWQQRRALRAQDASKLPASPPSLRTDTGAERRGSKKMTRARHVQRDMCNMTPQATSQHKPHANKGCRRTPPNASMERGSMELDGRPGPDSGRMVMRGPHDPLFTPRDDCIPRARLRCSVGEVAHQVRRAPRQVSRARVGHGLGSTRERGWGRGSRPCAGEGLGKGPLTPARATGPQSRAPAMEPDLGRRERLSQTVRGP